MDDFYMVLPSNVHWSAEPPNTTGNYKTPLPKPLELEQDRWQVALTEISYPQSWSKEIPAKLFDFTPYYKTLVPNGMGHITKKTLEVATKPVQSDAQHFKNIHDVIRGLNERIPKNEFRGMFKVKGRRVCILLFRDESIRLNKLTRSILGFQKELYIHDVANLRKLKPFLAEQDPDFNLPTHNMFIYCNLVQETLVGDVLVPLLRSIAIKKENDGKYTSVSFQHPRYCKLASTFFQHIHIYIANDIGEVVRFLHGKIVATLHFKTITN